MGCFGQRNKAKRRYKRLVDGVFPLDPSDGINNANMQKLTYYAVTNPKRLHQIAKYLWQRMCRELARNRTGQVFISMRALDQLLQACHTNLNLFVEYFLNMVERLLETKNPELLLLGTSSFVKFALIKEETPSYMRRHDFFVSKFSSMCVNADAHADESRHKIRLAGLRGLRGVVIKTVDDVYVNLWADMSKIIPALLFSMQVQNPSDSTVAAVATQSPGTGAPSPSGTAATLPHVTSESKSGIHATSIAGRSMTTDDLNENNLLEEEDTAKLAQYCLQDIASRANFSTLKQVITPMVEHFDAADAWQSGVFALESFNCIMYSIQSQFYYVPIAELLSHLNTHQASDPSVKAGIIRVFASIVAIAKGATGPSILQSVDVLLKHLRTSAGLVTKNTGNASMVEREKELQDAIVVSLGKLALDLPAFQQVDVMSFIVGKLQAQENTAKDGEVSTEDEATKATLKSVVEQLLLRCLVEVSEGYAVGAHANLDKAFPAALSDPLFHVAQSDSVAIRKLALRVLRQLLSHTNVHHHQKTNSSQQAAFLVNLSALERSLQKRVHWTVYDCASWPNSDVALFVELYKIFVTSFNLFGVQELFDFIRMAIALQAAYPITQGSGAASEQTGPNRSHLHAYMAECLLYAAEKLNFTKLHQYVLKVKQIRADDPRFDALDLLGQIEIRPFVSKSPQPTRAKTTEPAPQIIVSDEHLESDVSSITSENSTVGSVSAMFSLPIIVDLFCNDALLIKQFPEARKYLENDYKHENVVEGASKSSKNKLHLSYSGINDTRSPLTAVRSSATESTVMVSHGKSSSIDMGVNVFRWIANSTSATDVKMSDNDSMTLAAETEKAFSDKLDKAAGKTENFSTLSFQACLDSVLQSVTADMARVDRLLALGTVPYLNLAPSQPFVLEVSEC